MNGRTLRVVNQFLDICCKQLYKFTDTDLLNNAESRMSIVF